MSWEFNPNIYKFFYPLLVLLESWTEQPKSFLNEGKLLLGIAVVLASSDYLEKLCCVLMYYGSRVGMAK